MMTGEEAAATETASPVASATAALARVTMNDP